MFHIIKNKQIKEPPIPECLRKNLSHSKQIILLESKSLYGESVLYESHYK